METSWEYVIILGVVSRRVDTRPGQHPCRKFRSSTHCGLWSHHDHSGPSEAPCVRITPTSNGLHRRSGARGNTVKRRTFSRLRWLRLKYVTDDAQFWGALQFCVDTGAYQFGSLNNYLLPTVAAVIVQGEHPPRLMHPAFTESLWTLMQRCWNPDPQLRSEFSEIF